MQNKVIYVEKTNIFNTSIHEESLPLLNPGEILFKVDKFALTSNNITYAVTGFQIKYWDFFPSPEPWGIVPVWGFAEVIKSNNDEIKVGEQVYGYFPMAQYLIIKAGKINVHSVMDISEHRQELATIYNNYNRLGMSRNYPNGTEDFIPIVKPLFVTSFLIYQFLQSEKFFDAKNVIITSASSKTSLGLAYMLTANKKVHNKNIIGLTSKNNLDFVNKTGFYNVTFPYEKAIESLDLADSIVIDMAGNADLLWKIYELLDHRLKHVCKVGLTDWSSASMDTKIPVAKFFFAPTYAQEYFKEHGPKKANEIIMNTMFSFIESAQNWIEINHISNFEELQNIFSSMVKGEVDPSKGYVMVNE